MASPAVAEDVVLVVNGDSRIVLRGDEVDAKRDVDLDTQGTVRRGPGDELRRDAGGTSVSAVLEQVAKLPLSVVTAIDVPRIGSPGTVQLDVDEVIDGYQGDPLGERQATIYTGGGEGVRFFRPLSDGTDVNGFDRFNTPGANLRVNVTTRNTTRRTVRPTVSDDAPDPGQEVQFGAEVEDADGVDFRYSWDLGDGTSTDVVAPRHRYAAGRFAATVNVLGEDGSVGVGTVTVQVGAVAGAPSTTPTPEPDGSGPSAGGGSGGAGGGGGSGAGGGAGTPDQAATGQRAPAGGQGGRKGRTDRRRDRTPRPGASATPFGTPSPSDPSSPPAAAGTPVPGDAPAGANPDAGAGTRPSRERRTPAPGTAGDRIEGVLLAGTGSAQEVADLLAPTSPRPSGDPRQSRRGGGGRSDVLGWLGGGTLLLALLGAGAVREAGLRLPGILARRHPRNT